MNQTLHIVVFNSPKLKVTISTLSAAEVLSQELENNLVTVSDCSFVIARIIWYMLKEVDISVYSKYALIITGQRFDLLHWILLWFE